MRKPIFSKATILPALIILTLVWGCQKIVHGYLSDRIFYVVNPFNIQQGVTAVSASLVADGSTDPLYVKVLSLKDSAGNDADSVLTTPRSIVTYSGNVSNEDSTLTLLKAKLKDSMVRPFNIAEIGGRLQFTAATTFVPTGSYNMDLSVSNVRGTEVLKNACQINIEPLANPYNLFYQRLRYWNNGTGAGGYDRQDQLGITVDVNYTSGTPESKIIFKIIDKNYQPFNPAKGDVVKYNANWPGYEDWDPYYKPVYTDSTMEYQIPGIGLSFPFFPTAVIGGMTWAESYQALTYYKIVASANKSSQLVQVCTSLQYLTAGTYVVTIRVPDIERVP